MTIRTTARLASQVVGQRTTKLARGGVLLTTASLSVFASCRNSILLRI